LGRRGLRRGYISQRFRVGVDAIPVCRTPDHFKLPANLLYPDKVAGNRIHVADRTGDAGEAEHPEAGDAQAECDQHCKSEIKPRTQTEMKERHFGT
jgi:hypothetical protein